MYKKNTHTTNGIKLCDPGICMLVDASPRCVNIVEIVGTIESENREKTNPRATIQLKIFEMRKCGGREVAKKPRHIDIYFYYVYVTFGVLHLNCECAVFGSKCLCARCNFITAFAFDIAVSVRIVQLLLFGLLIQLDEM